MENKDVFEIISRNFDLGNPTAAIDSESDFFKKLQILLADRIEFLIRTDVDKLLQILYRIDVPQKDSDEAFDLGEVKKISFSLAEKIINRQLQKVDYAKQFYGKDEK